MWLSNAKPATKYCWISTTSDKMPKCPKCGKEIDTLVNVQSGEHRFVFDGEDYEPDGFFTDDGTNEWQCPDCNYPLFFGEGEATKFLKGEK
jgi:DNA-directed RNA polymerase subunit RPC12/RpoP